MWVKVWPCLVMMSLGIKVDGLKKPKRPNIIFILADDLGWNDVGFHGMKDIPTPNIDALAADGVVLNNYYVCSACSPSRAALLTGLYPIHTGFQHHVLENARASALQLNLTLLPQWLRKLDYQTALVGKWHLGFHRWVYTPTERGFDTFFGFYNGNCDHFHHTSQQFGIRNDFIELPKWEKSEEILLKGRDFRGNRTRFEGEKGTYLADLYTAKAKWIIKNRVKDKPLFLYLAHHAVHRGNRLRPISAPMYYVENFWYIPSQSRRHFAGALTSLDQSVGSILETLHQENILSNTIVVFSTDNGADMGSHGWTGGSNWPLRGEKLSLWEGGVKGVGIIWSPLLKKSGRISEQLMHITDWLPTLYHAAGGKTSKLGTLDGQNMWKALSEDIASPRNEILLNYDTVSNNSALRMGDLKLIVGGNDRQRTTGNWMTPTGQEVTAPKFLKLPSVARDVLMKFRGKNHLTVPPTVIHCGVKPPNGTMSCEPWLRGCLFDLKSDPCEYKNIADDKPQEYFRLLKRLGELQSTAVPSVTHGPLDFKANPLYHRGYWEPWNDVSYSVNLKEDTKPSHE